MSAILSAANSAALSILNFNDAEILKTQQRITTGLEVSSAADDPVRYFRALDLQRRAARLADIGKNIDLASTAMKAADNAMTSMRSQLDTLLKTISEARGTATGSLAVAANGTVLTGRNFSATSVNAGKTGNALATAAEAALTGKTLQETARSKQIFDTNGATSNASTAIYDGNLGLAVPAGGNARLTIRMTVPNAVAGQPDQVLNFSIAANTNGKDLTLGEVVDQINAQARASSAAELQTITAQITNDGRLRLSSGSTSSLRVSFSSDSDTVTGGLGSQNAPFGLVAADATTAITAATGFSPYEASMIGTGTSTFQDGDTFSIATTDRSGNRVSFVFQAVSLAKRTLNGPNAGTTSNPIKFTTVGDLVDAINSKFAGLGAANRVTADVVSTGTTNATANAALRLTMADGGSALSIQQIQNSDEANYNASTGADGKVVRTILANDLASIFGSAAANQTLTLDSTQSDVYGSGLLSGQVLYSVRQQFAGLNIAAPGGSNASAPDPKRTAAAEAFKATIAMLDRVVADSKLTTAGLPNLLTGEVLRINLGDTVQQVGLTSKLDRLTLGLAPSLAPTFATDAEIDAFNSTIMSAINTITTQQSVLSQNSTSLSAYSSFVNSLAAINSNYADTITRADTDAESNRLKALQTMQQLSQAVMSINNSMDANTVRLLY